MRATVTDYARIERLGKRLGLSADDLGHFVCRTIGLAVEHAWPFDLLKPEATHVLAALHERADGEVE